MKMVAFNLLCIVALEHVGYLQTLELLDVAINLF